jgi:hypothetical protein
MKKSGAGQGETASELISKRVAELGDWRGNPEQNAQAGESYKEVVKLTFAKGASLTDPARLFNSSLDGKVRRATSRRRRG